MFNREDAIVHTREICDIAVAMEAVTRDPAAFLTFL
jgi:hypothetical protein